MNKTKFAALALSFAVAASPFGAAAAEGGHWAQKSLERLAGMGILTGDDEGNLLPDQQDYPCGAFYNAEPCGRQN